MHTNTHTNTYITNNTLLQIHFLREKLYETESLIQVGLGRYTWQTLNVKYFCDSCQKLLKNLAAIVTQIGIMGKDIRLKVNTLEGYSLFASDKDQTKTINAIFLPVILKTARTKFEKCLSETPDDMIDKIDENVISKAMPGHHHHQFQQRKKSVRIIDRDDSIRPCLEYFKNLELERNEKTNKIQKLYDSIGPIMIKLESLILGTFSGDSDKMSYYYTHWEQEMFSALMRFTTKNLQEFSDKLMQSQAVFEVDAVLAAPEITMKPTANEIYNIMIHSVKNFLERYKIVIFTFKF